MPNVKLSLKINTLVNSRTLIKMETIAIGFELNFLV